MVQQPSQIPEAMLPPPPSNLQPARAPYGAGMRPGSAMDQQQQQQQQLLQQQQQQHVIHNNANPHPEGMSTLQRGLTRHYNTAGQPQQQMVGPADMNGHHQRPPTSDVVNGQPQRERSQSELGGNRDGRNRYFSDSTLYRNTIVHGDPPEKEFIAGGGGTGKQQQEQWPPKEADSPMAYTPFKNSRRTPQPGGRTTPLSPEKVVETFEQMQANLTSEQQQAQQNNGKAQNEANEFMPNGNPNNNNIGTNSGVPTPMQQQQQPPQQQQMNGHKTVMEIDPTKLDVVQNQQPQHQQTQAPGTREPSLINGREGSLMNGGPPPTGMMVGGNNNTVGRNRVPSRSSSVYSGISVYNQNGRRMSEGQIQPVLFQPIPQAWAPHQQPQPLFAGFAPPPPQAGPQMHQQHPFHPRPDLVYPPSGYGTTTVGGMSIDDGQVGVQQVRSVSRSASEMGMGSRGAFVAATLPRKLPSVQVIGQRNGMGVHQHQQQQQGGGVPQMGVQQRTPPQHQQMASPQQQQQNGAGGPPAPPQSRNNNGGGAAEFRQEFNPAEFPRKTQLQQRYSNDTERDSNSHGTGNNNNKPNGSGGGHGKKLNRVTITNNDDANSMEKKSGGDSHSNNSQEHLGVRKTDEERFLSKMRQKEERKRDLVNWNLVSRLSYAQILFGVLLFAFGLVRLIKMSVWGLGTELVFGVLVVVTGMLGVVGARKRHFTSLIATFVLSTITAALAVIPFVTALMVTVPDSFSHINEEDRKYFTNNNGLYALEIILAVICIIQAILSAVVSSIGCQMGGRILEEKQTELKSKPIPIFNDFKLTPISENGPLKP